MKPRLPRKLKKDLIKTCGRGDYQTLMTIIREHVERFGAAKFKIKKT